MTERWTGGVVGVWVLLSPWLLGFSSFSIAKWSNVIAGLILILVNGWALFAEHPAMAPATATAVAQHHGTSAQENHT